MKWYIYTKGRNHEIEGDKEEVRRYLIRLYPEYLQEHVSIISRGRLLVAVLPYCACCNRVTEACSCGSDFTLALHVFYAIRGDAW